MVQTYSLLLISALLFLYMQDASCPPNKSKQNENGFAKFFKLKGIFHTHKKEIIEEVPTSIDAILDYHNGFQLYASLIQAKVLINNYPSTASLSELTQLRKAQRNLGSIYQDLMRLGKQIIIEVDGQLHFEEEDYLKQAAYYRILRWLQIRTDNDKDISAAIDEIIASKKARNYLAEIYQADKGPEWIDSNDDRLLTLHGWVEGNPYDKYDQAAHFMKQIVQNEGENADELPMECTDITVYEDILQDADPTLFEEVFDINPCQMIEIVDKAIAKKIAAQQIQIESPYLEAIPVEEINLSQVSTGMERAKYATMLFTRAFQKKFDIDPTSEETWAELTKYPVRHSKIRYCAFQMSMSYIPIGMNQMLNVAQGLDLMIDRAYFYRLFGWYNEYTTDEKYNSNILRKLLKSRSLNGRHILADMSSGTAMIDVVFTDINRKTLTIQKLLHMGHKMDTALSTIMRVTLDELQNDRKNLQNEISRFVTATEATKANSREIERIQIYIDNILSYGMPEILLQNNNYKPFEELAQIINTNEFKQTFGKELIDILNKVNDMQSVMGSGYAR